jgi:hypothetical protein
VKTNELGQDRRSALGLARRRRLSIGRTSVRRILSSSSAWRSGGSRGELALRARRRSAKGAELELDIDARGWPAIAAVAVLAAALVLVLRWLQ